MMKTEDLIRVVDRELDSLRYRAPKIRRPEDERCELYEAGNFRERFKED